MFDVHVVDTIDDAIVYVEDLTEELVVIDVAVDTDICGIPGGYYLDKKSPEQCIIDLTALRDMMRDVTTQVTINVSDIMRV